MKTYILATLATGTYAASLNAQALAHFPWLADLALLSLGLAGLTIGWRGARKRRHD